MSSLLLGLKCVCMTFGVPVYSGHECLEQLPSITATYIVRQPDRPRFAVGRVIELAATYMLQTHRCTGLHPSVQCSLQQRPHHLHLLQQFLTWQLLSEGLPSLRLAVRSAQGSLRMCPLVTKLPGGSSMHQSYACRTDHCKNQPSDMCFCLCIYMLYLHVAFGFILNMLLHAEHSGPVHDVQRRCS